MDALVQSRGRSFFRGPYDGYSGEIGAISLAAHLAGQVDIAALYHSGVNRVAIATLDTASTYLVHSDNEYRSPFMQWLFPLLVDVSQRRPDNYPVPELASNPFDNAVRYQRDVDARLAGVGRSTLLQPDAGDDFSGTHYRSYSVFNDFGRPALFMPWSSSFTLLAEPGVSSPALAQLLASNLHGPFGLVDSAYWTTGDSGPHDVAARNDLWNTALSLMAFDQYLLPGQPVLHVRARGRKRPGQGLPPPGGRHPRRGVHPGVRDSMICGPPKLGRICYHFLFPLLSPPSAAPLKCLKEYFCKVVNFQIPLSLTICLA